MFILKYQNISELSSMSSIEIDILCQKNFDI